MKKMSLMALLVGAALFLGLGTTTAFAGEGMKCGPGKCGAAMKQEAAKCGAGKCGTANKKGASCPDTKKCDDVKAKCAKCDSPMSECVCPKGKCDCPEGECRCVKTPKCGEGAQKGAMKCGPGKCGSK